jgi:hypothetical protein
MEHELRQSRIALRLAEPAGSTTRSARSSTTPRCWTWDGDDIAMKARKYDHPLRSLAGAAGMLHMVGREQPLLHRFKVGLDFAVVRCA